MTREYKKKEIIKTETVLTKVECDICHKEMVSVGYETGEVSISHTRGPQYPECDCSESLNPDICSECFDKHIMPLLKSLGVDVNYVDNDRW